MKYVLLLLVACFSVSCKDKDMYNNIDIKITNLDSGSLIARREKVEALNKISMNSNMQEYVAKTHLKYLINFIDDEKDGVVKYWLISFVGNLKKYAKDAVPYLEKLRSKKDSSFPVSKSFKTAIPVALKKIQSSK